MFQLPVSNWSWLDVSLLGSTLLLIGILTYRQAFLKTSTASTVTKAKSEQQIGAPLSESFQYPEIRPFPDDPLRAKPIPYRPFKWGQYHVTMGIRSMPWDEWFEVDCQFEQFARIRKARIADRGAHLIQILPNKPGVGSGHPPAVELLYEIAEYLSRRYPSVYKVTRHPPEKSTYGWYGLGDIKDITVVPLNRTFVLSEDDPLVTAAQLVQEDLAIMVEGDDGRYYLQAGAVCVSGVWRLVDKAGMSLEEIHTSGDVPQFKSKLETSMTRFIRRMPVDKPVIRNNYTFQVVREPPPNQLDPSELGWSYTMKGNEDLFESEGIYWLREVVDGVPQEVQHESPKVVTPSMVWMRTERQTLRRLPKTRAVVFTIRVYQTQITELAKEPGVPGRLASAIRSWPEDVAAYKAKTAYEGILSYLDECHAKQVQEGLEVKEKPYPF